MVTTLHDLPVLTHGVFWVAVAFFVFAGLFGGRLWKMITRILDGRIATIRSHLAEAAQLRAEAEAMLAEATARQEAARSEAAALLARAHDEAARLARQMEAEAEAAAARRERMALERIAAAEQAVVTELRHTAIALAGTSVSQVLAESVSAEWDATLIDRGISEAGRALRAA